MSLDLKVGIDEAVRREAGREFQSLGAMKEKGRVPRVVRECGLERADDCMGRSGGDGVRWYRQRFIQIDRLMSLECFESQETDFEIDTLFYRKPMEFF